MCGAIYHEEDKRAVGRVVLFYSDAADAAADLPPRQRLAAEGASLKLYPGVFYRDKLFSLDRAWVGGNGLLFQLHPGNDNPRNVLGTALDQDLSFALCSPLNPVPPSPDGH